MLQSKNHSSDPELIVELLITVLTNELFGRGAFDAFTSGQFSDDVTAAWSGFNRMLSLPAVC